MTPSSDLPAISVILSVKNGMPHLKSAIEGLLSQTYRNFNLVVQDGVSCDGSLEYLRGLDAFFPIDIVSEVDGNMTIGYARAMRRATGDLVVAAACDEVLDADALETYVQWYKEHPEAVFIYGGSRIVTDSPSQGRQSQLYQPPEFNFADYLYRRMCPTMAGAFNRRLLGENLRLDESMKT
ncbi:MAG TPA: glycosyltransferase, partial [Alphaproteobacteria bacterium]|nr:glycosyltransferase [Alphaproteobacteria bacterium]